MFILPCSQIFPLESSADFRLSQKIGFVDADIKGEIVAFQIHLVYFFLLSWYWSPWYRN